MEIINVMGWNVALSNDGLYKYVEAMVEPKSEEHKARMMKRIANEDDFNILAYAEVIEMEQVHQKDSWFGDDKDFAHGSWIIADRPFEML